MNLEEVIRSGKVDFSDIPSNYYINMCKEPTTLKELSDILGSSHQNVKQILLKLEKKGFIKFEEDEA